MKAGLAGIFAGALLLGFLIGKELMQTRSSAPAGPPESRGRSDGGAGLSKQSRTPSLEELRGLLSDEPTRREWAELWWAVEPLAATHLRQYFLELRKDEGVHSETLRRVLLERLVRLDPALAGLLVEELEVEEWAQYLEVILPELAKSDPSLALELYHRLSADGRRVFPLEKFVNVLAEGDLEVARQAVEQFELRERARAYGLLIEGVSERDPEMALLFLDSLEGGDLVSGLGELGVVGRLARHAPERMAALADRLPMTGMTKGMVARVAAEWALKEPEKALEWVSAQRAGGVRAEALGALYRSWVKEDRVAAMKALQEIENPGEQLRVFGEMAREVIGEDSPEGARSWVEGLEGSQRSYALGLLGGARVRQDPEQARADLESAIALGGASLAQPSAAIGYHLAQLDAVDAGEWARSLEDLTAQEHAAAGVTRALTKSDPVAAANFLTTLPVGPIRNRSIGLLIEGIRTADPSRAFSWAASVDGDPERRFHFLSRAIDAWKEVSPTATREAIRELALSEDEKGRLLWRVW